MNNAPDSPLGDILCGVVLIVLGILMFLYRNSIGEFTGYYAGRGGQVDTPTPGWMLIPFALALIAGGLLLVLKSI